MTEDDLRSLVELLIVIDRRVLAACPDVPKLASAGIRDRVLENGDDLQDVGSMLSLGFGDPVSKAAWRAAELQFADPNTNLEMIMEILDQRVRRVGIQHAGRTEWFGAEQSS